MPPFTGPGKDGLLIQSHQNAIMEQWLAGYPHNLNCCWSIPFHAQDGSLLGTLVVCYPPHSEPSDNDYEIINTATYLAGILTERNQSETKTLRLLDERRFLLQRSISIQEQERKHLARELHDELGQCFTAIQADAETILTISGNQDQRIRESAGAILNLSRHVYDVVHSMMRELRPSTLDDLGLTETLKYEISVWQRHHLNIACDIDIELSDEFGETINITVYRIIQESLTNIAKHANASLISVTVKTITTEKTSATNAIHDSLFLKITDDGDGMDLHHHKRGLGLLGIRERLEALDGEFILESAPGDGVSITAIIPLTQTTTQLETW